MNGLVAFMNSAVGRILRIVIGLVLIYVGLFGSMQGSVGGYIVAIIGLVPLALGLTGRCLLQSLAGK
ncbi:MAG: DUF2892 domain-containing protein [Caldilineales bacterium]